MFFAAGQGVYMANPEHSVVYLVWSQAPQLYCTASDEHDSTVPDLRCQFLFRKKGEIYMGGFLWFLSSVHASALKTD